jgi:hypothetical protein
MQPIIPGSFRPPVYRVALAVQLVERDETYRMGGVGLTGNWRGEMQWLAATGVNTVGAMEASADTAGTGSL